MSNGLKSLLFILVTAIYAVSCVKGDNPITRPNNPRNQGGVPFLGPGWSKVNVTNNCVDVFFTNDTAGYLAGPGVFRSMDGGQTWSKTNAQDLNYFNLFFVNDKYGWAVSDKALAKTVDSGKTWQMHTASFSFWDVFFLDENNGFAGAAEGVFKTTDGGVTWSQLIGAPNNVLTLYFRDASNGFFATTTSGYHRTTDGGTSFQRLANMPNRIYNTQFFDALNGIAMGPDLVDGKTGNVYKTNDGGQTWNKDFSVNDFYLDFNFSDINNGFIMTRNTVYKIEGTTQTRVLYTPIPADNQTIFTECHFTNDLERGWVIYNGGELYRYVKP